MHYIPYARSPFKCAGRQAREGRASPHLSPHPHGGQLVYPSPNPGAPFGVLLPHLANGDAGAYGQQWATLMYPANPHVQAALAAAQQAGLPRPALPQGPPATGASFRGSFEIERDQISAAAGPASQRCVH